MGKNNKNSQLFVLIYSSVISELMLELWPCIALVEGMQPLMFYFVEVQSFYLIIKFWAREVCELIVDESDA